MAHGEHSTPGPLHLLSIYLESFSPTLRGSLCSPPLGRFYCTWSGTSHANLPSPGFLPPWRCLDLALP